jgi:hypothetical protein
MFLPRSTVFCANAQIVYDIAIDRLSYMHLMHLIPIPKNFCSPSFGCAPPDRARCMLRLSRCILAWWIIIYTFCLKSRFPMPAIACSYSQSPILP